MPLIAESQSIEVSRHKMPSQPKLTSQELLTQELLTRLGKPLNMRPLVVAAALLALFVSIATMSAQVPGAQATPPAGAAQDDSEYKISVQVGLVVLPVTVQGRQGHTVSGLEARNFRVLDDGRPQNVTLFEPEDVPAAVGLVVDDSGSMAPKQREVGTAAVQFASSSNPLDQMFVVYFNDTVFLGLPVGSSFTSDPGQLARSFSSITARGRTALYDAIVLALDHLKESRLERKALIVVSDGGDNVSRHTLRQVVEMAERSNAVIYAIGLFDPMEADQNPGVLRRLAKVTGGQAYLPSSVSEVTNISRQIAGDIRHQYTLGYVPSNPASGQKYHSIRVTVQGPAREGKLHVRTRTGYLAELETSQTRAASQPSQPAAPPGSPQ